MKNLKNNKESIFLILLFLFVTIFIVSWMIITGNSNQTFTDIVVEYTARIGSNKSSERLLVYLIIVVCLISIFVFYGKFVYSDKNDIKNVKQSIFKLILLCASISIIVAFVFYNKVNLIALVLIGYSCFIYLFYKDKLIDGVALLFVSFYALAGIYRMLVVFGANFNINTIILLLSGLTISLIVMASSKFNGKIYSTAMILLQFAIPLSLLMFIERRYSYQGKEMIIKMPLRLYIMVIIIIIISFIINFVWAKIYCKNDKPLISVVTICCVLNYNRYIVGGAVVRHDLHHPFENIIGYSQIVKFGLKPFSQYIPVSGFYSFVQGFFLSIFGNDNVAFYNVTENLFYIPIIIIVAILLVEHLGDKKAFLVSLLISIINYNRVALIIPIFLLLSLPKLINNRKLWLFVWFISSLINGLYYPIFGVATCFAFLPLGIYQIYLYKKEKSFIEDKKNLQFWLFISISIILVIVCAPLLIGLAKHILSMSSQTIYADGLSRFGQKVSGDFLPFIRSDSFRRIVFYMLTFLLPIVIVIIPGILAMKLGGIHFKEGDLVIKNKPPVFICLSIIILCCIAYSFTLVRLDLNDIFSRNVGIVYASIMMLLIIVLKNLRYKFSFMLIGISMFVLAISSLEGIWGIQNNDKLNAIMIVPDDYVYVDNDFINAKNCFLHKDDYTALEVSRDYIEQNNLRKSSLMGIDYFGGWFINDYKGMGALENVTVKGYGAAEETKNVIELNKPVVAISGEQVLTNYYLYNWLLTSGKYFWSQEDRLFHPIVNNVNTNDIINNNMNSNLPPENYELDRIPHSWGESMYELEDIFKDVPVQYSPKTDGYHLSLQFDNDIMGEDADFIMLSLNNEEERIDYYTYDLFGEYYNNKTNSFDKSLMLEDYNKGKKVYIVWEDERGNEYSVGCYYEKGNLLIPLGVGRGWLLNKHSVITMYVVQDDKVIPFPEIRNIRFLKLRSIDDE